MLEAELAVGGERDPLDVVLLGHGVGDLADGHDDVVSVLDGHGDVLLCGGVGGAGDEQLHGLAAAARGHAPVLDDGHDVAAVVAAIELDLSHSGSSLWDRATPSASPFPIDTQQTAFLATARANGCAGTCEGAKVTVPFARPSRGATPP